MTDKVYQVLFLCTGNSARSIMAESILNRHGLGRFEAHSAGSHPTGRCTRWRSSCWSGTTTRPPGCAAKAGTSSLGRTAPPLHFVFTVCDRAAGEVCPVWPGQPMTAHWGVDDPAAFVGPDDRKLRLFRDVYFQLERRIQIFTNLPIASLDRLSLQKRLDEIGRTRAEAPAK